MPSSKEVRARQNRQKERVAAQRAERQRQQHRRRRMGATVVILLIVVAIVIGFSVRPDNNSTVVAPPDSTTLPAGKQCKGLLDPLPKGSPTIPLKAGPAPTKLEKKDLKVGTGALVPKNAKVSMNYVGIACSTGVIFDSSYSRSQTFDANLSPTANPGVIAGWQQGIPGMRIGGVRLLSIPPDLAYGATGQPPDIGPDEPLYFLVQAVKLG